MGLLSLLPKGTPKKNPKDPVQLEPDTSDTLSLSHTGLLHHVTRKLRSKSIQTKHSHIYGHYVFHRLANNLADFGAIDVIYM